ncbi:MAG: hypothetical protein IT269_03010 [Saprospiraceae bacterium]|nr:hypothetical protein [Saprospiraceae bacterium]
MKNYLASALVFSILILLALLSLSFLPKGLTIGPFELRHMDVLSDVRRTQGDALAGSEQPVAGDTLPYDTTVMATGDTMQHIMGDTASHATVGPFPPKDSADFGRIIEDYTFDQSGLNTFFQAIDSIRLGKKVRVAWYGDSFVEGDILLADMRDTLQSVWGGHGVGFVPVTSEVAQFRRSYKQTFRGWETFSILKKVPDMPPLGLNGFAYIPETDAKIHYEGLNYFKNTGHWGDFRLFYTCNNDNPMIWQMQDAPPKMTDLKDTQGKITAWEWSRPGSISAFAVRFTDPKQLTVYGASLEDGPGIYLDNFSVRGNSGGALKLMQPEYIRQFDRYQQYNLIILQVGMNAVTSQANNIRWYEAELDRTITHLRNCFPGKKILVISVGDRANKTATGELKTMRSVPMIVHMQRELARRHGLLFFDLFHGMGGENTMIKMAHQRPRLANLDYTHLTHDGGKVVGHMMANLFLMEKERNKRVPQ